MFSQLFISMTQQSSGMTGMPPVPSRRSSRSVRILSAESNVTLSLASPGAANASRSYDTTAVGSSLLVYMSDARLCRTASVFGLPFKRTGLLSD